MSDRVVMATSIHRALIEMLREDSVNMVDNKLLGRLTLLALTSLRHINKAPMVG